MKQCKHPFVKRLRKQGYSTTEAVRVINKAVQYRNDENPTDTLGWRRFPISCWFYWGDTPEGVYFWCNIQGVLER